MGRIHPAIIVVIAVVIVLVAIVILVKPVLVLPTVTVPMAQTSVLGAYQRQLDIDQLDLRIRTNGRMAVLADGQELVFMSYNPTTLGRVIDRAERMLLPPNTVAAIKLIPVALPRLSWDVFLTSLAVYYVIPLEITVRFING
jgi:hypothetical protein